MQVGFIGLGTMGASMAANLQKAGYDLVVHDVRRASAEAHVGRGAKWADTPRAVAEASEVDLHLAAGPAGSRGRGARARWAARRHAQGRGLLRSLDQLADAGAQDPRDLRRTGRAHARRAGQRRAGRRALGPDGAVGRRRGGRVQAPQAGARRHGRPGPLRRPDRRRLGRQARAQLRRLCHPGRPGRGLRHGRQGRGRAAGAVGGGAHRRGRPPAHLRWR